MEHLTQKQIEAYSQHQLGASELLSVGDHLADCETCRRRLEAGLNGNAAFFALHGDTFGEELSEHLTAEQTAEYVDKNLSGESLQVVTDHLAGCEQCVFAVEDLRAFRNEIAPTLDREYLPATVASTKRKESWLKRFATSFRVSPVPAFGGAALAVLLLAVVVWLVWRASKERQPEIVAVPTPITQPSPSSEPLPSQPETAAVVAQVNDGGRVLTLDQEGKLSGADDLPDAYQNLLTKTLSTQRIERSSQLQGLTRRPSSLMSAENQPDPYIVLEPVGKVLLSNKTTFRWSHVDVGAIYVVEVYDAQFRLVAKSPVLTTRSWTTTLPRGKVYSWQVKATKDGQEYTFPRPPLPQAKFRVVDQAKANELAQAKRAYGSSHLTLALLYADAGLLREAEQELRLLRRTSPELASRLLRQVQAFR